MPVNAQAPVAVVKITMSPGPNGLPNIETQYSGPNRDVFNMMIARAQQDMIPLLIEKEKQKVVLPDPEMALALGK